MGIVEFLKNEAREEGEKAGIKKGREEGREAGKLSFAQTLIRDTEFDDQKIAALAGVEEKVVRNIRVGSC